jgi:hypothetical protein
MDRASANVKAERLNHARELLQLASKTPRFGVVLGVNKPVGLSERSLVTQKISRFARTKPNLLVQTNIRKPNRSLRFNVPACPRGAREVR